MLIPIGSLGVVTFLADAAERGGEAAGGHHGHGLLMIVGLCIVAGTILAYVAKTLRQPLLLAYIVAGVIIGPLGMGWVGADQRESVESLATLGLAFLMFIVGMEIDVRKLLALGWPVTALTLAQVIVGFLLGWATGVFILGGGMAAVYIGFVVAFSSTMIVVKLLTDRAELDTLPGRLTLGVLLFEDVIAIVVLAIQPSLGEGFPILDMGMSIVKSFGLVVAAMLVSRYVLPMLFRWVAMSPEVLLLSAITWCFVVSGVALAMGLSEVMGAMIAGVSIGSYPYALEVTAKLRSLRDFFVTLFFVTLGLLLTTPTWPIVGAALALTAVVIVSRFISIWPVASILGYGHRVGILNSIHRAQISEFGLIIILLGLSLGHFGDKDSETARSVVTITVVLLVVSAMLSTYLIIYSHPIAAWLMKYRMFRDASPAGKKADDHGEGDGEHDAHGHGLPPKPIILVGCFRVGSSLVHEFKSKNLDFSVIDFNPEVRDRLGKLNVPCLYGDISHLDTLRDAGVHHAKVLISTIPDDFLRGTTNLRLMQSFRQLNPKAKVVLTAESINQALEFYKAGADYVIVPRILAARHLVNVVSTLAAGLTHKPTEQQISELSSRSEVVH